MNRATACYIVNRSFFWRRRQSGEILCLWFWKKHWSLFENK